MTLPMTKEQRTKVNIALIGLDELMGEDVACTIVLHKIGEPWLNFTLTDGPPEDFEIKFNLKERGA